MYTLFIKKTSTYPPNYTLHAQEESGPLSLSLSPPPGNSTPCSVKKSTQKQKSQKARNPDLEEMALEWVVLGYAAAAEAIMVLLLTIPGLDGLRKGLIAVTRNLLKPFLSVVPFCLFLLMDIYWKYETRPSCETPESCTPAEYLRHQKSIIKSQRNALLIAAALVFYWLLYSVTALVVRIEQLNQRLKARRD
jgi:hypothetical protein